MSADLKFKRIGAGCYTSSIEGYEITVEYVSKEDGAYSGYNDQGWFWELFSTTSPHRTERADYAVDTKWLAIALLKKRLEMDEMAR